MKAQRRIEIHGDAGQVAAGSITNHNHYWTSGYPTEGMPELPWWEMSDDDLGESLKTERAIFWQAWRRYWFNVPSILMMVIMIALVARVALSVSGLASGSMGTIEAIEWWFVLGSVLLVTPVGVWMTRIRRVEGIVAAQAQANIDALRTVQVRRRWARR